MEILLVLPISAAGCECIVSSQNRIKSRLRASLKTLSLEGLNKISALGESLEEFDPVTLATASLQKKGAKAKESKGQSKRAIEQRVLKRQMVTSNFCRLSYSPLHNNAKLSVLVVNGKYLLHVFKDKNQREHNQIQFLLFLFAVSVVINLFNV